MLKSFFLSFFIVLSSLMGATVISVKIAKAPCRLYVASYYGKGVALVDSLVVCEGVGVLERPEPLPQGIYFITDGPKGERFEFLLGVDQDFAIELNGFALQTSRIIGAEESEAFLAYQKVVQAPNMSKGDKMAYTQAAYEKSPQGSFLKLILKAMLPPPTRERSTSLLVVDNTAVYDYNALHFWDNYDLSDDRLLRTPFFAPHVELFLRQVLPAREDKIMAGMKPFLSKAEASDGVLKLVASAALGYAVENSVMGIDALGYEVIARYYLTGRLGDLPVRQKNMLVDYVSHTEHCRVGQQAKEMRLDALEVEKGEVSLYATDAAYTLVLFWEPDCDYCKELLPILRDDVMTRYKDKGLCIFAVNTQRDYQMWKRYIVDQKLFGWQHGYQAVGVSDFMVDYGVQGTPFMYLLDRDKKIIAKNVKLEYLDAMLRRLFASGSIY